LGRTSITFLTNWQRKMKLVEENGGTDVSGSVVVPTSLAMVDSVEAVVRERRG